MRAQPQTGSEGPNILAYAHKEDVIPQKIPQIKFQFTQSMNDYIKLVAPFADPSQPFPISPRRSGYWMTRRASGWCLPQAQ